MASADDGSDVPFSPMPGTSSNYGSPTSSGPDLDGMGHRSFDAQFKELRDMLLPAMEQNVSTLTENVNSLTARICKIETNATSISSVSDSASSWNLLGQSDGSTATGSRGSHGPGSSDDNRNTRRRLETFSSPEDEHARRAVLLRFPCEQDHTGITIWINSFFFWKNPTCQPLNEPVRNHCKAGSVPARFVFETRAKSQDFVDRYKDDGIPFEIDSRFCNAETVISVRQSRSLEDWEIGKQFAPLWRVLAEQLKTLFHDGDDQGAFIVPALDACSQVLSIKDRRRGSGKPLFKLAPSGSAQLFTLVAPDLCVPGIAVEVLQRVISQLCTAIV